MILLILLVFICCGFITKISFDFDFESFFPNDHPDREVFTEFKERFAYDNDFLLLTLKSENGIFKTEFLKRVKNIADSIRLLDGTEEVLSPTSIALPVKTSLGLSKISVLHPDDQDRLTMDSIRLIRNDTFEKTFFSTEHNSIILRVRHRHFEDIRQSETYVRKIYDIIDFNSAKQYHLAGRTSVQSEFISLIQTDFGLFIIVAFSIIIIFLKIQYGTWPAVLVPLALIITTILTTLGIMTFLGYSLNILTVLIPTIISFVAISDVIHFYTKYQSLITEGMPRQDALLKTVREIGLATFLTSLTTGIGFISLVTIEVLPVQLLGVFTALGVFIAFIYTFILLPYFAPYLMLKDRQKLTVWKNISMWCFRFASGNQTLILVVSTILLIVGIYGATLIRIDAYLLDDLPESSFSRQSFSAIDKEFGGTKPWNLYFYTDDSTGVLTKSTLEKLNMVQRYLKEVYGLRNMNSPVEQIKLLRQSYKGGLARDYALPDTDEELSELVSYSKSLRKREINILGNPEANYGRISGFIPEWGSHHTSQRDQALLDYLNELKIKNLSFHITGTTYLIDRSHEYLSVNLFWGLLFAFIAVAIISVILFRSIPMIIISLIPNVLPVLLTAAVIGYFGIPIKLTTSIIFAVSFGIAVDDTIHFISKFRFEKAKHSTLYAVRNTFKTAGTAIIKTTVLLCLGFGVFCFSNFGASFFTGFFIVLSLIFALITDLFLLPVLLLKFYTADKGHD